MTGFHTIRHAQGGHVGNALQSLKAALQTEPVNWSPPGSLAAYVSRRPPGLALSRRGINALVMTGDGNIEMALRLLRRRLDDAGVRKLMKANSTYHVAYSKSQKQRMKRAAAKRRVLKAMRFRRVRDYEAPGTRRGVPRKGVVTPAA